jgi:hypothetical protein
MEFWNTDTTRTKKKVMNLTESINEVKKTNLNNELKPVLFQIIKKHFEKYLTKKLKTDILKGVNNSFVCDVFSSEFKVYKALGRSIDSSMGILHEKLLVASSKYYNDKTFKTYSDLTVDGKKWIIDLGFVRNGDITIIEIKLNGELDNKKVKSEKRALMSRKKSLMEAQDCDVKFYLGIVGNKDGGAACNWKPGRITRYGFDRSEVLVSEELYTKVTNDTEFFSWFKREINMGLIQPVVNDVISKILNLYI